MMGFTDINNEVLDRIIRTRHSVRGFKEDIPPKELVEQVIEAGRLAPYAGLANKGTYDFRRFFVIPTGSEKAAAIRTLVLESVKALLPEIERETDPRAQAMLNVLRMLAQKGLPPWKAPYLIIVAERRGFPSREDKALAYCLQNMWLKASAAGLGMQLFSAISDLEDTGALSVLLELPRGEFSFDACILGYPEAPLQEIIREEPRLMLQWLD